MYNTIIGIDISKNDFVVARHGCKEIHTFANTPEGFVNFSLLYQQHFSNCLIVLEVTGGYEQALTLHIMQQGIKLHKAPGR